MTAARTDTDRQTDTYDVTNLIVTFRNFANAPKIYCMLLEIFSRNVLMLYGALL